MYNLLTAARNAHAILADLASRVVGNGTPIQKIAKDLGEAIAAIDRHTGAAPMTDIEFAMLITTRLRAIGLSGAEIPRASALSADVSAYIAHRCDDNKVIRGAVFNLLATMQHVDRQEAAVMK